MLPLVEYVLFALLLFAAFCLVFWAMRWCKAALLARRLQRIYDGMTVAERFEQRVAWVCGVQRLTGRPLSREQVREIVRAYDRGER